MQWWWCDKRAAHLHPICTRIYLIPFIKHSDMYLQPASHYHTSSNRTAMHHHFVITFLFTHNNYFIIYIYIYILIVSYTTDYEVQHYRVCKYVHARSTTYCINIDNNNNRLNDSSFPEVRPRPKKGFSHLSLIPSVYTLLCSKLWISICYHLTMKKYIVYKL